MSARSNYPSTPVVFTGSNDFLKTLRTRADAYFAGRSRRGDPRLYRKAAVVGVWFTGSYVLLLTTSSVWVQLVLCLSYALAACALGFNVFHDANHGSFSPNARVNSFLSW